MRQVDKSKNQALIQREMKKRARSMADNFQSLITPRCGLNLVDRTQRLRSEPNRPIVSTAYLSLGCGNASMFRKQLLRISSALWQASVIFRTLFNSSVTQNYVADFVTSTRHPERCPTCKQIQEQMYHQPHPIFLLFLSVWSLLNRSVNSPEKNNFFSFF